jgi:hypothetical protein
MKKLSLTKKVPQFSAYLWDGTVESYRALVEEISSRAHIEFHMSDVGTWLSVEDNLTMDGIKNMVMPKKYILLADEGLEVVTEDNIKRRFDVIDEQKVYTGSLAGGPLDAWNNSTIRGPLETEDGN